MSLWSAGAPVPGMPKMAGLNLPAPPWPPLFVPVRDSLAPFRRQALGVVPLAGSAKAIQGPQSDQFVSSTSATPDLKRSRRFAVIGDSGNGSPAQQAVAAQLDRLYQQAPFASMLMLGDNVYEDGEPHLFRERLYEPYKNLYQAGVNVLPVLGNHDARLGYEKQQLQYMGKPRYYSTRVGTPGREEVELFAIDTTVFLPGMDGCYQDNPFAAKQIADAQLAWLDKGLAKSPAKFKIVYGHYPIYSSGLHGDKYSVPQAKLRGILEPVFNKHKVELYLAGHEHHYERSMTAQGVQHIVSGGGGANVRPVMPDEALKYSRDKAISRHHAMMFEITPAGSLQYSVYGTDGSVLDAGSIRDNLTQVRFG